MVNNPIPIILVLAAISRRGALPLPPPGALNTLELEAFLDNARTCINTIDKLNGIAHSGLGNLGNLSNLGSLSSLADLAADAGSSGGGDYVGGSGSRGSGGSGGNGGGSGNGGGRALPDMKKIMEIVENLPL